ncbi:MAG TPA: ABC transporter permease [Thermoplasmata archaeon]|nr:ABC transporter permease [Thermoplasmata archaeon]
MTRAPITSVEQWWIAFRYQLRFYLRTYRFLGLLLFVVLIGVAVLALQIHAGGPGVSGPSASNRDAQYLANSLSEMSTVLILVGAFLGGDAIATDFGTGAGYFVLVQPIKRPTILAGRYAAAFVATAVIAVVYYLLVLVGAVYFFGVAPIPGAGLAASLGLAFLMALAVIGIAFLFSSFFRSPAVAMVVTVLVLYLAFSIVTGVIEFAGYEPWFSLSYAGGAISGVLDPGFVHASSIAAAGSSFTIYTAYPWEGAAIMVGYLVVGLALGLAIYLRKESKG